MKLIAWIIPVLVCCITCRQAHAQAVPDATLNNIIRSDSIAISRKSTTAMPKESYAPMLSKADTLPFQPNPKRAALFSAMIPGVGQIYNRQYWKLPIVYGLAGVATFFLIDNTKKYQKFRRGYVARLTDPNIKDEFTNLYSADPVQTTTILQTLQDAYKQDLDLTVLLTGVGYALQVLDALAFAHLKNFDISPNISLRMQPVTTPVGPAIGFVAHLK